MVSPEEPPQLGLGPRIARADIPELCERARMFMDRVAANRVVCDVGSVVEPDAVVVEALARLQLTARRLGREVRLGRVSPDLRDLLLLMGLAEVILAEDAPGADPAD
jgi:anti-anti-sigma regulatory factor